MRTPRDPLQALKKALLQHSTEHNLGLILKEHGQFDQAQPLTASALAGFESAVGPHHPKTLHAMHSVGLLAAAMGSQAEAAACFFSAFTGRQTVLGPDANDTLRSAIAYGQTLTSLQRYSEAEEALKDVGVRGARVLGAESPLTLQANHMHALALAGLGQRTEAIAMLRRVHGARLSTFGESHRQVLESASDLGELLGRNQASRAEARALLLSTLAVEERILGVHSSRATLTRERLRLVRKLIADGADDWDDDGGAEEDGSTVCAVLLHLYIAPAHRRRGVARRALPLLAQATWRMGATRMLAAVPKALGAAASALLLAAGFIDHLALEEADDENGTGRGAVRAAGMRAACVGASPPAVCTEFACTHVCFCLEQGQERDAQIGLVR